MNKKIKSLLAIPYTLLAIGFIFMPFMVSAANVSLFPTGYWGPLVSCTGINCNMCSLFETAQMVIYFMMTLTLFVIAPIMITIGGISMLIAGGNEERFKSGKKMVTGAVIGIMITLVSFLIVNTFLGALTNNYFGGTGSGFTISCTARSPYVPPSPTGQQNQNTGGYVDPSVPQNSIDNYGGQQYPYEEGQTF